MGYDRNILSMFVYPDLPRQSFVLSLVYGPSRFHEKRHFWTSLMALANTISDLWLVVGDFNSVCSQSEKRGGRLFGSSSSSGLLQFTNAAGLIDLGFNGNPFTWNNGRQGCANIRKRLDRGLANHSRRLLFPNASILHSPAYASDHLPVVLNTDGLGNLTRRPFRFEAMWIRDAGSFFTVLTAWAMHVKGSPGRQLIKKMDLTKHALLSLNKLHFGSFQDQLRSLTRALDTTY